MMTAIFLNRVIVTSIPMFARILLTMKIRYFELPMEKNSSDKLTMFRSSALLVVNKC